MILGGSVSLVPPSGAAGSAQDVKIEMQDIMINE
jgi:hypothetical protein